MVVTSSSVSEWAENADGFQEYRAETETNLRGMIEVLVLRCSAGCHKCPVAPTRRCKACLPSHATRDKPRRHYSQPGFPAFTSSAPRISTLWNREGNRISAAAYRAGSTPRFACCSLTR